MKRALILNAVLVTGMTTPTVGSVMSDLPGQIPQKKSGCKAKSQPPSLMVVDLKTAGLWPDVEADEKKLLLSNQISERQQIDASWLGESIASLLWALEMTPELPAYDQEIDPALTGRLRSAPITELIRQAKLRQKREIEKQREVAELWHWRSRTRQLQELEDSDDQCVTGPTIEQIIEKAAVKGARSGRLPQPIARDFPALGKPYCELSSGEYDTLASIARERHKAFNWLCGFSPTGRWADTRTDT